MERRGETSSRKILMRYVGSVMFFEYRNTKSFRVTDYKRPSYKSIGIMFEVMD